MTAALIPVPGLLGMFNMPGGAELIILLVLGLLIFGKRLPEVGRSLGRGIVEFKRGIKGIDDEIETESARGKEPAKVSPPVRQELPRTAPPAEPRVSRGDAAHLETASESDRDAG